MRLFFQKKKKRKSTSIEIIRNELRLINNYIPSNAYSESLGMINRQLETLDTYEERLLLLDYYINALITEISASYKLISTKSFYVKMSDNARQNLNRPINWFPTRYIDENMRSSDPIIGTVKIDLSDVKLISLVTKSRSIGILLKRINKGDPVFINDHSMIYIPYLNLLLAIEQDHHRLSALKAAGRAVELTVNEYDLIKIFDYISTDGERWIQTYSSDADDNIYDHRFPLIFSLAKQKYAIEKNHSDLECVYRHSFLSRFLSQG